MKFFPRLLAGLLLLACGSALAAQLPFYGASPRISRALPTRTDDATKGYAVGNIWTVRQTNRPTAAYILNDATAGKAIWQKLTVGLLPGDVLNNATGGVVGLYGSVLLNSSYTGPALQARRVVDNAVQDIGFVTNANGQKVLDIAAIQAFAAAGPAQGAVMFSGNAAAGDTLSINGFVTTFVASGATGQQVNIGASGTATAAALQTYLAAQTDTRVNTANYATGTNTSGQPMVVITAKTGGSAFVSSFSLTQSGSAGFYRILPTTNNIIPYPGIYTATGTSPNWNATLTVAKLYDQSGSGHDASQPNGAQYEPTLATYNAQGGLVVSDLNGIPCVAFDSRITSSAGALTTKFLVLPSTVSVPQNAFTFAMSGRVMTSRRQDGLAYLGAYSTLGGTTGVPIHAWFGMAAINGNYSTSLTFPTSPITYVTDSATKTNRVNNKSVVGASGYSIPSGTLTGGYIGIPVGSIFGGTGETNGANVLLTPSWFDMTAMVIVNRVLSAAEMTQLQASLAASTNVAPQVRDVFVQGGDSISQGMGASLNRNYSAVLQERLNRDYVFYNVAYYGTQASIQLSELPTYVQPIFNQNPYADYAVYDTMIGTNDLVNATSDATIEANIIAILNTVRSYRSSVKTVVETILARGDFTGTVLSTTWPALNTRLTSNFSAYATALVDVAGLTPLGLVATATGSKVYMFDQVHTTSYGSEIRADVAVPVIDSLTPPLMLVN